MLLVPRPGERLQQLATRIRLAGAPSRGLVDDIVASVSTRLVALEAAGKTRQFEQWRACGAWTEVALALVELELPKWSMRRLVQDDGVWLCSLSQSPVLPAEFDEMVETSHESMPLAIFAALIEARRATDAARANRSRPARVHRRTDGVMICCDNFS